MSRHSERWIHLNMCMVGGFLGAYALINHTGLFGSAQTTNLISIAMGLFSPKETDWFLRIIGVFVYMAGLSSTVFLPHFTRINLKLYSIFVDFLTIVLIGFFPKSTNHYIALFPIFFAMAIQWNTFRQGDGYVSSCIFSTNNLRQLTTSMTEYFCSKDQESLRKAVFYAKVLGCFHTGVLIGWFACHFFAAHAAFLCLPLLFPALILTCMESGLISIHKYKTAQNPL